jgi:hypothetical protein
MNCLDCHPRTAAAVAICGRCGAGLCAEHIIETEDHLTFIAPINRSLQVAPSVRHLRCSRCAAAERAQALRRPYDEAHQPDVQVAQPARQRGMHARRETTRLRDVAWFRTRRGVD